MHPKIREERINYRITVVGAKKHIYMEYVFIELSKTGAPVNSPLLYFVFYQCVYTFNFLYWVTAVQQFTENHRATIFVNYVCVPILHCAEAQIRLQRSKFSAASGRESLPHTRRRRQPLPEPSSPASPTTSCLTLQPRVSSTRTRVNYNELFYIFHQSPDPSPQGSSLGSRLTFVAQEPITGPRTLWVLSDRLLAKKKMNENASLAPYGAGGPVWGPRGPVAIGSSKQGSHPKQCRRALNGEGTCKMQVCFLTLTVTPINPGRNDTVNSLWESTFIIHLLSCSSTNSRWVLPCASISGLQDPTGH